MANRNFLVWGIVIALLIGTIGYVKVVKPAFANHDDFAKCLSSNGAVMYGAYWCPHCQEQKKMFGKSQKYMPYVECAVRGSNDVNPVCEQQNIESFPTWKFKSGQVVSGAQPLDRLAQLSGCEM